MKETTAKKVKILIVFSELFNKEISILEQQLLGETITETNLVKITKNASKLSLMKDAKFVILDEIEYFEEYFEDSEKLEKYYKFANSVNSKNDKDILSDVVNRTYSDGFVDESLNEKYLNEFNFLVQKYMGALESLES
ncbi:MAG: hypothetical protein IJH61_08780 [Eubacteriaceae bacterium]|nr:hypothetical protein [Eubacteriaceae bacterium]